MDLSLKKSLPWLVLAGSGGLADLVSDVLENVSAAPSKPGTGSEGEGEAATKTDLRGRVTERVLKHFSSEQDTEKLVDKVMNDLDFSHGVEYQVETSFYCPSDLNDCRRFPFFVGAKTR